MCLPCLACVPQDSDMIGIDGVEDNPAQQWEGVGAMSMGRHGFGPM